MFRKIMRICLFMILLAGIVSTVSAQEVPKDQASGQTEVVYIPDKRPDTEELDKGEGHPATTPNTGEDTRVSSCLKLLVIALAVMLMLIIYIKKGETDYEEN